MPTQFIWYLPPVYKCIELKRRGSNVALHQEVTNRYYGLHMLLDLSKLNTLVNSNVHVCQLINTNAIYICSFVDYICIMEMKERIELLLHFKNASPSQFAEEIGVQRSSVSHILSGRNKPSLDFIKKIVDRYPEVSYGWLIEGNGELAKAQASESKATAKPEQEHILPTQEEIAFTQRDTNVNETQKRPQNNHNTSVNSDDPSENTNNKKIKQIIIFYEDGSFENYNA